MSNEHDNELEGIGEQMKALAARGIALQTREVLAGISDALDGDVHIDPVSFVAGAIHHGARHEGAPEEIAAQVVAAAVRVVGPALAETAVGMPDPDSAFDDLPVYDPENGS